MSVVKYFNEFLANPLASTLDPLQSFSYLTFLTQRRNHAILKMLRFLPIILRIKVKPLKVASRVMFGLGSAYLPSLTFDNASSCFLHYNHPGFLHSLRISQYPAAA